MNKYRLLIIPIFLSLFTSCVKDKSTLLVGTVYNKSGKNILIQTYKFGILDNEIHIDNGNSLILGKSSHIGTFDDYGFDSEYINNSIDSIIIIFDHSYSITHYLEETTELANKHYLPSSPRNIFKGENYELIKVRTKKENVNYNNYYITEADYEYAKD